jgi:hypothetical protein
MLGWCWHHAAARGDGLLRSTLPVVLDVDEPGEAHELSIHWADLNVETRVPFPKLHVTRGQALTIFQPHAPMLQPGNPPAHRLPPVTTKNALEVTVPVGAMGASGVA